MFDVCSGLSHVCTGSALTVFLMQRPGCDPLLSETLGGGYKTQELQCSGAGCTKKPMGKDISCKIACSKTVTSSGQYLLSLRPQRTHGTL